MANSGQSNERAEVAPRKREVSREEQERIDQRREAKAAETRVLNDQAEALKKERIAQAEAR